MAETTGQRRFEELDRLADAELGEIERMSDELADFYAGHLVNASQAEHLVAQIAREAEARYLERREEVPQHVAAAAMDRMKAGHDEPAAHCATSQQAYAAIRLLMELGESVSSIADRVGVKSAQIQRWLRAEVSPNPGLVRLLDELAKRTIRQRMATIGSLMPISVVETCNDRGVVVDDQMKTEIRQVLCRSLVDPCGAGADLPEGIRAAVAAVGHGMYLVKVHQGHSEAEQTRLLIHELEHIVARLREQLPRRSPVRPRGAF